MKSNNLKLTIDKDIKDFVINSKLSIRKAFNSFGKNNGLPLIVINEDQEFIGTLSNGDIRIYLSNASNTLNDSIENAVNKNSKYCFENDDKSICEHLLYDENIKILPIIDIYKN